MLKLKTGKHKNPHLQASFNKNGEECLVYEVLYLCSREDLLRYEQTYLDVFEPAFNICKIAGSPSLGKGRKMSDVTRAKMSKSAMGNTNHTGKKASAETKARQSKSKIGNLNCLGYKHSDETKRRMAESRMGLKHPEEQNAAQSLRMKAYHANKKLEKALKALLEKPLEQPLEKPLEHKQQEVAA